MDITLKYLVISYKLLVAGERLLRQNTTVSGRMIWNCVCLFVFWFQGWKLACLSADLSFVSCRTILLVGSGALLLAEESTCDSHVSMSSGGDWLPCSLTAASSQVFFWFLWLGHPIWVGKKWKKALLKNSLHISKSSGFLGLCLGLVQRFTKGLSLGLCVEMLHMLSVILLSP